MDFIFNIFWHSTKFCKLCYGTILIYLQTPSLSITRLLEVAFSTFWKVCFVPLATSLPSFRASLLPWEHRDLFQNFILVEWQSLGTKKISSRISFRDTQFVIFFYFFRYISLFFNDFDVTLLKNLFPYADFIKTMQGQSVHSPSQRLDFLFYLLKIR